MMQDADGARARLYLVLSVRHGPPGLHAANDEDHPGRGARLCNGLDERPVWLQLSVMRDHISDRHGQLVRALSARYHPR